MCNLYTQSKSVDEVARLFRDLQMPLTFRMASRTFSRRDRDHRSRRDRPNWRGGT
jgi:hypothetical protein